MISTFPLMAIPLIVYNVLVFGVGVEGIPGWRAEVFSIQMVSGVIWSMTMSDLMIVIGLFFLFLEILKATRIGRLSIIDHLLSTVVLILYIVLFLLVPSAASSTFFILTLMALVDVMAGFSVSIRSATRDVSLGDGSGL
ncbi:hypothetical protein ACFQ14_00680 [Pseudahrensia aquimaris]|uniref:Transmembrane protein n=1 Tax=Pseudahrensia aquimaris TaxID=744461 RepID=A0ABW3FD74_9HYPH